MPPTSWRSGRTRTRRSARSPSVSTLPGRAPATGAEILYDDRNESPGVKFTDAEMLGMPWILTVSPRSIAAGGVEVTERATGERSTRSIEEVEALIRGDGTGAAEAGQPRG